LNGIKSGDRIIWEGLESKLAIRKPPDFFSQGGSLHLGTIPDNEEELLTPEILKVSIENTLPS